MMIMVIACISFAQVSIAAETAKIEEAVKLNELTGARLDSIAVETMDQLTGEMHKDIYQIRLKVSGAGMSQLSKTGSAAQDGLAYSIELVGGNNQTEILKARVTLVQTRESFKGGKVEFHQFSAVMNKVSKLLSDKYKDRDQEVTSISLLGVSVDGTEKITEDLDFNYSASGELGLPEISASYKLGLKYKNIILEAGQEVQYSQQWNNGFTEIKSGVELGYKVNKNATLSLYIEQDKVDAKNKNVDGTFSTVDTLENLTKGVRFQSKFN